MFESEPATAPIAEDRSAKLSLYVFFVDREDDNEKVLIPRDPSAKHAG
jgi:hypothetical protein